MQTDAEKVAAFLDYLEIGNPSAVRQKLVRSGKEPFVVFRKNVLTTRPMTAPPQLRGPTSSPAASRRSSWELEAATRVAS